jgi:molecular chaperone GrpE
LESFLQGVELVQRELLGTLANHSICEVEALGKAFDPAFHEALAQLPDGSVAPNTVIDVLQKGYQLHDRLLRPAGVVVAKAPEPDSEDGADSEDAGGAAD